MKALVLLFVATFVPQTLAYGSECSVNNLLRCRAPIEDTDKEMKNAIVHVGEQKLREYCAAFVTYKECTRDIWHNCEETARNVETGAVAATDYICGDGMEEYLGYQSCLATPELNEAGRKCNRTLMSEMLSPGMSQSRICRYSNEYVECVVKAVKSSCGNDAAKWYYGVLKLSNTPLLNQIHCHMSDYSAAGGVDHGSIGVGDHESIPKPRPVVLPNRRCSNENIHLCLGSLKTTHDIMRGPIIHVDEQQLEAYCRGFDAYEVCERQFLPYCKKATRDNGAGFNSMVHYLCADGMDEYLNHADCFAKTELIDAGRGCMNTLHAHGGSCSHVNEYAVCGMNAVRTHCGEDAAKLWFKLNKLAVTRVLNDIYCELKEPEPVDKVDPLPKRSENYAPKSSASHGHASGADARQAPWLLLLSAALLALMVGGTK